MTRVLIVDDHQVVRDGVKKIVLEQPGMAAFGEASTPQEALRLAAEQEWDIVILDLSLSGRSGLEVLKELRKIQKLPVLILSMHSEEQYARRAFRAGAAGYITKDATGAELLKAINKVIAGGKYVSPALGERLIDIGADSSPQQILSDREFEVMCLIASGRTVGEIAALLFLSDKTISTYRTRILTKMGMKTSAALMHFAIQNKLTG